MESPICFVASTTMTATDWSWVEEPSSGSARMGATAAGCSIGPAARRPALRGDDLFMHSSARRQRCWSPQEVDAGEQRPDDEEQEAWNEARPEEDSVDGERGRGQAGARRKPAGKDARAEGDEGGRGAEDG